MDLSTLSTKQLSEEGSVLTLLDPRTDEPLVNPDGSSVMITLSGMDGQRYRDHQRRIQNRRLKGLGRGKSKIDLDAEEMEKEALELLAACTIGWSGIDGKDGNPLPFTTANAELLYGESWIRIQVDQFIGDRQNFFLTPAKSSSSTTVSL